MKYEVYTTEQLRAMSDFDLQESKVYAMYIANQCQSELNFRGLIKEVEGMLPVKKTRATKKKVK